MSVEPAQRNSTAVRNASNASDMFARMRHQLRHGFDKRIIKELDWLSKSKNTAEVTKPILCQVQDYLLTHSDHIQYQQFKKQGLPIGN